MSDKVELSFGYNKGVPDSTDTAWGCRAIFDRGYVDIPGDRQEAVGPRTKELMNYLNDNFNLGALRDQVREQVHADYPGMPQGYDEYVLFEDKNVIVKCNTQRSFGYLYICAYFKGDM